MGTKSVRVLLPVALLLAANIAAAGQNLKFSKPRMALSEAFGEILAQTGRFVSFNEGVLNVNTVVSVPSGTVTLQDALGSVLGGLGMEYSEVNGQILVTPKTAVQDRSRAYSGYVRDSNGEALPGAMIRIGSSSGGVMTDAEGKFSLKAPRGTELTASYIGYADGSIILGDKSSVVIRLESDTMYLEETVCIGYGAVKKKDLTTAVSVVPVADIDNRPIVSAAAALQGKAAGVQVIQPSGMPGTALSIRVRGATSVQASNEPLYVVDGIPMDDISSLSADDIASLQVLKDASSSAIYGARAANGVVLITTKHGEGGRTTLKFSAYAGFSRLGNRIEALNTEEYKELMKELAKVTDIVPAIPDSETRYTDWTDRLFGTGVNQNYQIALSSGTDKLRYYISAGHTDEKGIVNKAYFKRSNVRANVDSDMFKWLTISLNAAYSHTAGRTVYESRSSMRAGSILSAINTPPFMQVWNPDDPTVYDEDAYGSRILNPLAANAADMTNSSDNILGTLALDFKPFKGLDYKVSYSIDVNNSRSDYYLDPHSTSDGRSTKGYVSESVSRNMEWMFENVATYHNVFANRHDLTLMAGATLQHAQWNGNAIAGYDLPGAYPELHSVAVANQIDEDGTWASSSGWALASFFGRLNYAYDSRYLFTVNMRGDGSSKFAPGHRWGFFPSASAAWRIINEDFMEGSRDFMDDFKIRAGWGMTGNQGGIGNYSYLASMRGQKTPPTEDNSYPGLSIMPNSAANPDLTWETTSQLNAGIDLSFFKTRLVLTADAYYKRTDNLLLTVSLPDNVNLPGGITRNDGKMENMGMELQIASKNFVGEFKWDTDFNLSFNRNRVLALGLNKVYYYAGMYTTGEQAVVLREGLPLGTFFGYSSKGVNPDTGDIEYEDISGNGTIGPEDRTVIGCAQPKFVYGFTNEFSWKGISLSVFFQGSCGNKIFNASRIDTEGMIDFRNQSKTVLKRWKRPGMVTDMPRSGNIENIHNSSRFVEDGSYLRLKSLTLSYDFPAKLMNKAHLQGVQVYVTGQNLLTFTKYSGYDPEVNAYGQSAVAMGVDYGTYPQSRTCIFGVNLTF